MLGSATLAAIDDLKRIRGERGWRAMMLAPNLEVFEALLRGERVPKGELDPLWLARFGNRR